MLLVDTIHFEDRFCARKKGGIGLLWTHYTLSFNF